MNLLTQFGLCDHDWQWDWKYHVDNGGDIISSNKYECLKCGRIHVHEKSGPFPDRFGFWAGSVFTILYVYAAWRLIAWVASWQ